MDSIFLKRWYCKHCVQYPS